MVDFIVLGIVPGTSYQIQIVHVMVLLWVLCMGALVKKQIRASARMHQNKSQTERTA